MYLFKTTSDEFKAYSHIHNEHLPIAFIYLKRPFKSEEATSSPKMILSVLLVHDCCFVALKLNNSKYKKLEI